MKQQIQQLLAAALTALHEQGDLSDSINDLPMVERARDQAHGDFATNVALVNAKTAKMKPRDLAEKIVAQLPDSELIEAVNIAGPGFINFKMTSTAYLQLVPEILAAGHR